MGIKIALHKTQKEVYTSKKRFKAMRCGRRWGKTHYALSETLLKAFSATEGVAFYVAPTLQQAKDIAWNPLKQMLSAVPGVKYTENTAEVLLPNGIRILFKGSDRPDTLRGAKLFHAVIDEYQDMKPDVFDAIIQPALMDLEGSATIIGTPKGMTHHFYRFVKRAEVLPDWGVFHYTTFDNPMIPRRELERMRQGMSSYLWEQEIMAKFKVADSDLFKASWIQQAKAEKNPIIRQATTVVSADLCGYTDYAEAMKTNDPKSRLDEYCFVPTAVFGRQWHVFDMVTGRDTISRTARSLLATAKRYQATSVGVEKGALFQAIYPTLVSEIRELNVPVHVRDLTHNNRGKVERILWALQGRLEHGLITFEPGAYLDKFTDQLMSIPHPGTHDDMPDALSMIEQLAPLGHWINPKDMVQSYTDELDSDDWN